MYNQLSCEQVGALITFYAENKLSDKLSQYVKEHLENCPACMEKYLQLKSLLNKFAEIQNEENSNEYHSNKQYETFKSNLSAYIDNELDDDESIKIKKIAISNPLARQDLENIYTYKKMLFSAFEKTKNDCKYDYSKAIISKIQNDHKPDNKLDPFLKLSIIFFTIVTLLVSGIIILLYF